MITRHGNLFKITSELNDFIDFIICINSGDLDKAELTINHAYDMYWEDDLGCNCTVPEYIDMYLHNGDDEFDYTFYLKEEI